jgi:PAS domain S-box-containing protein
MHAMHGHRAREIRLNLRTDAGVPVAPSGIGTIVEGISAAFCVLDREFRYVHCNGAAERYYGCAKEALVGRIVWDAFPQILGTVFETEYRRAMEEAVPVRFEAWSPVGKRWLEVQAYPSAEGLFVFLNDLSERVRAAKALEEKEAELRTITDAVPALIAYVDADGIFRLTNRAYEKWFGVVPGGFAGRHVRDVIGAEAYEQLRPYVEAALRGETVSADMPVPYRRGTRWVTFTYTPDTRPDGSVRGFVAHVTDITPRVRTERELGRVNRELVRRVDELQTLFDAAPVAIWLAHDAECTAVTRNARAAALAGLPPEAKGRGALRSDIRYTRDGAPVPPDSLPLQRAAAGATVVDDEFTFATPGRPVVHLVGNAAPLRDEEGRPRGAVAVLTDITSRKRAEERVQALLRISEKLSSTLDVDALLDILVAEAIEVIDAEGGTAGLRTPAGMVAHRYFQDGASHAFEFVWPPGYGLPGWLLQHKRPYVSNEAATDPQMVPEIRTRFGVRSVLSVPILDAAGEPLGFFQIHNRRDGQGFAPADQELLVAVARYAAVAAQNALAYRQVREAEAALKEADRRKDEFLATLAHELRNPLAPIRNAVQILAMPQATAREAERARGMIERQLGQMVRLVDDLLDLGRIASNKIRLRRSAVDLAEVLRSAVETSRPLVDAAGHDLAVALPQERLCVHGDPTRLAQAVSNLLNNAAKYTNRNGNIWLSAERDGRDAIVRVRDTGIGIAPAQLPRIFDMFSQAAPALERAQGGLGIGLALVRGIVAMHGGSVVAHSEGLGRGAEFVIRLPLLPGAAEAQADDASRAAGSPAAPGLVVLVVDDNRDAAESLAMMLQLAGHATHVAHDGLQAVGAASVLRPDVVLLDIGLPKLNGYEAARRIRAEAGSRPVRLIAISGWGQEDDKRRAAEAGFHHHLTKPVDPDALLALIARPRSDS